MSHTFSHLADPIGYLKKQLYSSFLWIGLMLIGLTTCSKFRRHLYAAFINDIFCDFHIISPDVNKNISKRAIFKTIFIGSSH